VGGEADIAETLDYLFAGVRFDEVDGDILFDYTN
jgi:hypothetical protein